MANILFTARRGPRTSFNDGANDPPPHHRRCQDLRRRTTAKRTKDCRNQLFQPKHLRFVYWQPVGIALSEFTKRAYSVTTTVVTTCPRRQNAEMILINVLLALFELYNPIWTSTRMKIFTDASLRGDHNQRML